MPKPNILFIIADDHRFDGIGASGNSIVKTPVLDSLAEKGISFTHTHVMGGLAGGLCAPCRAAVLTGVNVFRTSLSVSLDDNKGIRTIHPDLSVLPRTLKNEGYYTYAIGKWHNDVESFAASFSNGGKLFFGGMSNHRQVPVYDFDPTGKYPKEHQYMGESFSTEMFCDEAVRFLHEYRDEEKPFMLYMALTAPHDPRTPPEEYASMYDPQHIPLPDNYMPEHPFDNGHLVNRDERLAPWPRTPDEVRRQTADYYGMISHMDAQIGRVLQALEERGDAENTIVVYTADHGIAIGRHGLMGKQNLYEHSIRVPLIVKGPGLPPGHRIDALVYSADLFPTLCELIGIPIPETVEMPSLVPMLKGLVSTVHDSVYAAYKDIQRMVSDGEWKLIRYYRSTVMDEGTDTMQLFHLQEDPAEMNNLASDPRYHQKIADMAERLENWQRQVKDPWASRTVLLSN